MLEKKLQSMCLVYFSLPFPLLSHLDDILKVNASSSVFSENKYHKEGSRSRKIYCSGSACFHVVLMTSLSAGFFSTGRSQMTFDVLKFSSF
jgi:hypothetical protein